MIMHAFGSGTASDQAVAVVSGTFKYGVAWLPEFLLTLALAALLGWSLWRDRDGEVPVGRIVQQARVAVAGGLLRDSLLEQGMGVVDEVAEGLEARIDFSHPLPVRFIFRGKPVAPFDDQVTMLEDERSAVLACLVAPGGFSWAGTVRREWPARLSTHLC